MLFKQNTINLHLLLEFAVVVVGHKPQKSEKSETKNEGTKDEVH